MITFICVVAYLIAVAWLWMAMWSDRDVQHNRSEAWAAEAAKLKSRVQEVTVEKLKLVADLQEANRRLKKIREALK